MVVNPRQVPQNPGTPVTQADLARTLGLSRATVSRALRNDPLIPEARCRQIQQMARQMGYQVNAVATALSHHRRRSKIAPTQSALGWINAWIEPAQMRTFRDFDLYWRGAVSAAEKFGYRLEEFIVNEQMPPRRLQKILLARNIRGLILPPHGEPVANWAHLDWSGFEWSEFAVVRMGHTINLPLHAVSSDQTAAGMLVFNQIYSRGYERIAFVGRETQNRLFGAGFLWAQRHQTDCANDLIFEFPDGLQIDEIQPAFEAWLKQAKPDAIFADVWELPEMLKTAGIRVPEEMGLAATTVLERPNWGIDAGLDQNPEEIGRVAVLSVIAQLNENARGIPQISRNTLVDGRWVNGASLPDRRKRPPL